MNVSAVNDAPILTLVSPNDGVRTTGNSVRLNVSCYDADNATLNITFLGNITGNAFDVINYSYFTDATTQNHSVKYANLVFVKFIEKIIPLLEEV
jgi:L-rhamnose isomerase